VFGSGDDVIEKVVNDAAALLGGRVIVTVMNVQVHPEVRHLNDERRMNVP
jgi:hypothetical protein